jgi:hypothetical protein
MASDKKAGRNKKDCEAYRKSNQEARNARLKQERHAREMARHAAKRAYKASNPNKPWGETNTTIRNDWLLRYGAPRLGEP